MHVTRLLDKPQCDPSLSDLLDHVLYSVLLALLHSKKHHVLRALMHAYKPNYCSGGISTVVIACRGSNRVVCSECVEATVCWVYSFVSSTNMKRELVMFSGKSLIKIPNKHRPDTDPCGIPLQTDAESLRILLIFTFYLRPLEYFQSTLIRGS